MCELELRTLILINSSKCVHLNLPNSQSLHEKKIHFLPIYAFVGALELTGLVYEYTTLMRPQPEKYNYIPFLAFKLMLTLSLIHISEPTRPN